MTMSPRTLSLAEIRSGLARLGLSEWAFVHKCSRADRCSANGCPLDPLIARRTFDPLDREPRCPMSRGDRERTFARLPPDMKPLLPFGGLFRSEWTRRETARKRWDGLTPEQQDAIRARARKALGARKQAVFNDVSAPKAIQTGPSASGGGSTPPAPEKAPQSPPEGLSEPFVAVNHAP